jgi:hypothetical protein
LLTSEQHLDQLDDDSRRRMHANPMRILDSKNPALQTLIEAAPKPVDYLGPDSRMHFEGLQQLLADLGIPFRLNPRLVRGSITTIELFSSGPRRCWVRREPSAAAADMTPDRADGW